MKFAQGFVISLQTAGPTLKFYPDSQVAPSILNLAITAPLVYRTPVQH